MKREIMGRARREREKERETDSFTLIKPLSALSLLPLNTHVSKPKHAFVLLFLKGHGTFPTLLSVTNRGGLPFIGGYESRR